MTTRVAWLLVVALTLAMFAVGSHAGGITTLERMQRTGFAPVAGGGYVRVVDAYADPIVARIWTAASGGVVRGTETATINAVRGPLAVSSVLDVSVAGAAGVIGRCLGSPVCVAASAAAVAIASEYRAQPSPSVTTTTGPQSPSDVVQWDPGAPPSEVSCNGWTMGWFTPAKDTCNASEWCTGRAGTFSAPAWPSSYLPAVASLEGSGSTLTCVIKANPSVGNVTLESDVLGNGSPKTDHVCIPSEVVVGGVTVQNTPGFDGKCRTGAYSSTLLLAALGTLIGDHTSPTATPTTQWRDAVRDAVENGGQSAPASITTTGPATQTGTPTTSTTTSGGTTTTTTTTPTTTYHYDGDTITYNNTFVTVTNNGDETTTTEGDGDPTKPEDPCNANPNRAGCTLIGVPPTTTPEWGEKTVSFVPEDMPTGSCPADRNLTFHGWLLPIHYAPLCDNAGPVRLAMLATAGLIAAGLIARAVSSS